jgi:hypothetical protein
LAQATHAPPEHQEPALQSPSLRHCTQALPSHWGVGAEQAPQVGPQFAAVSQGTHRPEAPQKEPAEQEPAEQTHCPPWHCGDAPVQTPQVLPQCSGSSAAQASQAPRALHHWPAPHWASAVQTQTPPEHSGVAVPVQTAQAAPQWSGSSAVQAVHCLLSQNWPAGHEVELQTQALPAHTGVAPLHATQSGPQWTGSLQARQSPPLHQKLGPQSWELAHWQAPPEQTGALPEQTAQSTPQWLGSLRPHASQAPPEHQAPGPHWPSEVHLHWPSVQTGVAVAVQSVQPKPQWVSASQAWQAPLTHQAPAPQEASLQAHCPPTHSGVSPPQG